MKNKLKVFKWLDHIAKDETRYARGCYMSFRDIYTCYGRLYATNGIVLAEVTFPEYEHVSDDGFMVVHAYKDDDGNMLDTLDLVEPCREMRTGIFNDMFPDMCKFEYGFKFNPQVMKDAIKPFDIYGLRPIMSFDGDMCVMSAHNREVSIRVLFMGVRR